MADLYNRENSPFMVNTVTASNQLNPKTVALTSGGYVVLWSDDSGVGGDTDLRGVKAQIFDASGNKIGGEILVNTTIAGLQDLNGVTALAGGGFAVTWSNPEVMLQIFDQGGNKVGPERALSPAPAGQQSESAVTQLASGNLLVVWEDRAPGNNATDIKARLLDASGTPIGGEFLVNTVTNFVQDFSVVTALATGGFVIGWASAADAVLGGQVNVKAQIFDNAGIRVGGEFAVGPTGDGRYVPSDMLALPGGGFIVAFSALEDDQALLQRFDASGSPVGGPVLLAEHAGWPHLTSVPGGGWLASWEGQPQGGITVQLFDAAGTKVGGGIGLEVNSASFDEYDLTTLTSGNIVAAFRGRENPDIFVQLVTPGWKFVGGFPPETFCAGSTYTNASKADGRGNVDTLVLQGNYNLTLNASSLVSIEVLELLSSSDNRYGGAGAGPFNYAITPHPFTTSGTLIPLTVSASGLKANESLTFNGGAETNGFYIITGGAGADSLSTGTGNDQLDGRGGADMLSGGGGNDIYFAYGSETIVENAGGGTADEVRSYASNYILAANVERLIHLGTQTGFQSSRANSSDNVVIGSSGSDLFNLGDGGNDDATGGAGIDYFYFGASYNPIADRVVGGADYDFLILQGNYPALTLFDPARLTGIESIYLLSGFHNRYGGATGTSLNYNVIIDSQNQLLPPNGALEINASGLGATETLRLEAEGDPGQRFTIYGGVGADNITTGGSNDTIDGGAGADYMAGRGGDDIYFVDNGLDVVAESIGSGYDVIYTSVSYSLRGDGGVNDYIEELATRDPNGTDPLTLTGNSRANRITGNAGNNSLYGGLGNDTLFGGGGNDNMFGEGGQDQMLGGLGDDVYYVDDPFDRAAENAGEGFDTVYTSVSYKLFDDSEIEMISTVNSNLVLGLTLTGSSIKNTISGDAGNNALYGEGGNDTLYGHAGSDYLIGGTGADYMIGGAGDDVYYVDEAGDIAQEAAGEGFDQVYVSNDYLLAAGSSVELLGTLDNIATTPLSLTGNDEAQTIAGNAGANILLGRGGRDSLIGGAGDDLLDGGTGDDVLEGGSGADTFRFSDTAGAGVGNALGWIRDFASEDTIDLSRIDANANTAGDDAFTFVGTGAFTNIAGQLRYDVLGSTYRFYGDLDGNGVADFSFDVTGALPVSGDFML